AAVTGGGVVGEGAAVERQRPVVVEAAAAVGASAVVGEGAVVDRQRAEVEQSAAVVVAAGDGAAVGDGQPVEGHHQAGVRRPHLADQEDPVGVVAADRQVVGPWSGKGHGPGDV